MAGQLTDDSRTTLRRIARTGAFLLLGTVGTAVAAFALLNLLRPIQSVLFDVVYLQMGPTGATEFATLGHFVVGGAVSIAAATLAAEYVSDRGTNAAAFGKGFGAMGLLLVLLLGASIAASVTLPLALVWVAVVAVAVPVLLRYRYGVRSGGVPAFVGGVPVLVLLLLLAGIGLGWGWGYVLTAQEVPASSVGDAEVADFDEVPAVRDDLFEGDCSETGEGTRVCYLQLRGYEHEMTATRFLARHGVRCRYQGSGADPGSFVARHDGDYYRVSCGAHGD